MVTMTHTIDEINAAIAGKPEEDAIEYLTGLTVGEIEFIAPSETVTTYTYGNRKLIRRAILSRCLICGETSEHKIGFVRKKLKEGCLVLCDHCSRIGKDVDFTGQTLHNLHVLHRVGQRNGEKTMWHVRCLVCGGEYDIDQHHLGVTRSCSCGRKKGLDEGHNTISGLSKGGSAVHGVIRHKINKNNKSGARGVSCEINRQTGKPRYRAYINFKRRQYFLGFFDDLDSAIEARKAAEAHIYGDYLSWYAETYPEQWEKYTEKNPAAADKAKNPDEPK